MVISLSDLGIGASHADGGHTTLSKGVGSSDRHAGTIGTQNHRSTFGNQSAGSGHSLVVGGLIINDLQLHVVSLTADLHGRSDRVCVLHTQDLLLAASAVVAGEGFKDTDDHGVAGSSRTVVCSVVVSAGICGGAAGSQTHSHDTSQQKCKNLLHLCNLLEFYWASASDGRMFAHSMCI